MNPTNDRKIFTFANKSTTVNTSTDSFKRMSEKHPDFEIQADNTIRPPDIEYTKTSQPLVPIDLPLSVIKNTFLDNLTLTKL